MAFVTGLFLVDAPASALNNAGNHIGELEENVSGVKAIRTREGDYPYVSAQAFRYWLRTTIQTHSTDWQAAPIYREKKIAYTDSNPILWWDDDLFGYMRVPSKEKAAVEQRQTDILQTNPTDIVEPVTRNSPLRVSTLVAIAPVKELTQDFGVMARHEGYPVPHEHQLYHTTLKGLFSLDLHVCGTFSYQNRSGYRNLDATRLALAQRDQLEHLAKEKAYRLPTKQRIRRIQCLFEGLARLEGGAKLSLHYTDVSPVVSIHAVTRGGNHIFNHIIGANRQGLPDIKLNAFEEVITTLRDDLLSPIYIGWVQGYLDDERAKVERFFSEHTDIPLVLAHPRQAYAQFVADLENTENVSWLV